MMLMIWSIATYMKELSIRSTIGPHADHRGAGGGAGERGLGDRRVADPFGPESSTNPSVEPSMFKATSSPMMNTRSSRRISSYSASRIACR